MSHKTRSMAGFAIMPIEVKRAYEKPSLSDGTRVLVERQWPRGLKKEAGRMDVWLRDLAPSSTLMKWFEGQSDTTRAGFWPVFKKRYMKELCTPGATHAFECLHQLAEDKLKVTLVYAIKDEQHNTAVLLRDLLEGMRKPPSSSGPARAAAASGRQRMRMSRPK